MGCVSNLFIKLNVVNLIIWLKFMNGNWLIECLCCVFGV